MRQPRSAAGGKPAVSIGPNHSLQQDLHKLTGAHAMRVVDGARRQIHEHAHDWPVLSLYVSGSLSNWTELGVQDIRSPSVVLYGPGAAHANNVGEHGFEQIQIEFDPDWLKLKWLPHRSQARHWVGGHMATKARDLARTWCSPSVSETLLLEQTKMFLEEAVTTEQPHRPNWVDDLCRKLGPEGVDWASLDAEALALSRHWLRQAYRASNGEGIRDTIRRKRVEIAASLLRDTAFPASEIAFRSGFCDQSHMIRCFRAVLGRTPQAIRSEWTDMSTR